MTNGDLNWITNYIWGIADDVLRDLYVRGKYRDVILPMTVLRRLDAVLEDGKQTVLDMKASLDAAGVIEQDAALRQAAGQAFYNASRFTLRDLRARSNPEQLRADFEAWLDGFSPNVQDILTSFEFRNQIPRLARADALGALIEKLTSPDVNLSPDPVTDTDGTVRRPGLDNHGMGTIFEELVRRFNEEAGEHWTPRDAVRLMAKLVFLPVADGIESGTYLLYDGACGTGGMLTVAEETLQELAAEHGKQVSTHLYGQEINAETYAICKADLLLKGEGEAADNIVGGPEHSTLANDAFPSREFDFMLSNPPYGKSWKTELERKGGRKGMRDPRFLIEHHGDSEFSLVTRSSDGQMLFLANMLSKMKQHTPLGSRIAEVHNGSSLFTGEAGQGESNIRRWIIENDWLDAIVALPLNMFYNTGIATYVWVLANRKPPHRRGRVQLIDATGWHRPLGKNLGKKNCELGEDDITRICETFLAFEENDQSRIFDNAAFGYWKVTVERPLRIEYVDPNRAYGGADVKRLRDHGTRNEDAPPVIRRIHKKGTEADPLRGLFKATVGGRAAVVEYEPDADLRDTEHIPLQEVGGIEAFLGREVLPYAPDAWVPAGQREDRLRDQLQPLFLQAAAHADAEGDPRRHPGAGTGDGRAARRHNGGGGLMLANLKPYPEVKHSGVEWLGEVPTHWEVRRLASIGTFSKGKGGSKDDEVDAGVPCIRYGDLYTTHLHTVVADEACTTVVLTPAATRLLEEDDTHLAVELYRYIIGAQAQSFDSTQALDKRETK